MTQDLRKLKNIYHLNRLTMWLRNGVYMCNLLNLFLFLPKDKPWQILVMS